MICLLLCKFDLKNNRIESLKLKFKAQIIFNLIKIIHKRCEYFNFNSHHLPICIITNLQENHLFCLDGIIHNVFTKYENHNNRYKKKFFTLHWVYTYLHVGICYGYAYMYILYRVQCAQYTNTLLLQYFITIRGPFSAKGFSAISINFIFRATCNICPTTLQPFSKSQYPLNLPFLHYHLSCLCSQVYVLGSKYVVV